MKEERKTESKLLSSVSMTYIDSFSMVIEMKMKAGYHRVVTGFGWLKIGFVSWTFIFGGDEPSVTYICIIKSVNKISDKTVILSIIHSLKCEDTFMYQFLPGIGDTHVTVDVVQGVVVPEKQQQVVGVREHVQRNYHSEEHGHPGSLQEAS
jgi:hypothetical protein